MRIDEAIITILFDGDTLKKQDLLTRVKEKVGEVSDEDFKTMIDKLHDDGKIIITTLSGQMNTVYIQVVFPSPAENRTIILDVETTGLNVWRHQVLEFAAVLEDWTTPIDRLKTFHAYVKHDEIVGDPFALKMNRSLIDYIYYDPTCISHKPNEVTDLFASWLAENNFVSEQGTIGINVGGKNVGRFDLPIIENDLFGWLNRVKTAHRIVDPGSLYFNPRMDKKLPDLQTCLERAGIYKEVEHRAFADCYDTIRILRNFYLS